MTFTEACARLGISEYEERILKSNSHGELFHLADYFRWAETVSDDNLEGFKIAFEVCVRSAGKSWRRPESVFQHMPQCFADLKEICDESRHKE